MATDAESPASLYTIYYRGNKRETHGEGRLPNPPPRDVVGAKDWVYHRWYVYRAGQWEEGTRGDVLAEICKATGRAGKSKTVPDASSV